MVKPFVSRELIARVSLQLQLGKRRRILEKAFAQRLDEVERRRQEAEQERKRQEYVLPQIGSNFTHRMIADPQSNSTHHPRLAAYCLIDS